MRELSDESALHQAEQFVAYAGKVEGTEFERWCDSKDFGREDRRAISERVAYVLMRGAPRRCTVVAPSWWPYAPGVGA